MMLSPENAGILPKDVLLKGVEAGSSLVSWFALLASRWKVRGLLSLITVVFVGWGFLPAAHAEKIKVACMGDSITYGAGITASGTTPATWEGDKYHSTGPTLLDQDSYPEILQGLLGDAYDVRNFGASGRTATGPAAGLFPYFNSVRDGNTPSGGYTAGVSFAPDVILLMLGTNDTKTTLWATSLPRFKADYKNLVQTLQNLPSKPYVVICYPIPVEDSPKPNPASGITESNRVMLLPIINEVIAETGAGFINTNTGMPAFSGLLSDQVHPSQAGAAQLAKIMDAGFPITTSHPSTGVKSLVGTRPQVAISAPTDRSVLVSPGDLTVTADATPELTTGTGLGANAPVATDYPITKVEFFHGSTKFGESTTPPYAATASALPPGVYSVTARATNNVGLSRDSAPVTVFVSAQALPAGGVPFIDSYSQDFDGLVREVKAATVLWINDQSLPGWFAATFASSTWTPVSLLQGDDGGSNVAAMKSLGVTWARNRSLGTISFNNRTAWGVCLLNASPVAINQITLQYTGEQWRVTTTSANNKDLTLEMSTTATALGQSAGYSAVSPLTFRPPATTSATTTKMDGKLSANRQFLQQTLTIPGSWQPGGRLWLRWSTGSGQSAVVALDDLLITAGGGAPGNSRILPEGSAFRINWDGIAGSSYMVDTSTNLLPGSWLPASPAIALAGNATVVGSFLYNPAMASEPARFFRIRLLNLLP